MDVGGLQGGFSGLELYHKAIFQKPKRKPATRQPEWTGAPTKAWSSGKALANHPKYPPAVEKGRGRSISFFDKSRRSR